MEEICKVCGKQGHVTGACTDTEGQTPELATPEETQEMVNKHREIMTGLVESVYTDIMQDRRLANAEGYNFFETDSENIRYKFIPIYGHGKQQPVIILEVCLPDEKAFQIVCKRDGHDMHKKQQESAVLQKVLPKIFLETESGVAGIEKVNGLEQDQVKEALDNDESLNDQLATDAVDIFDNLAESKYEFIDVDFPGGWNVIYDLSKKQFRVFDIHSFHESNASREEKLMKFLNRIAEIMGYPHSKKEGNIRHAKFASAFIREYFDKHPDASSEHQGKKKIHYKPGIPGYDEELAQLKQRLEKQQTRIWMKPKQGQTITIEKQGKIKLHEEIKQAALDNDIDKFMRLLEENGYSMSELIIN